MAQTPSDSLAQNLQQVTADKRAPYVVTNASNPSGPPNGYAQPHDFAALSKKNQSSYAVMSRTTYTPELNRSFKEVSDRLSSVRSIAAFTGLDQSYISQNYDSMVQRLYPNSAPSPTKIKENFDAMLNNAWLLRDLNDWYYRKMMGDESSRTANHIAALERNIKPTDEYIRLMPQGTIRRQLEEGYYSVAEQYPIMRDQIGSRVNGAITGALVTSSALAMAYMTGGLSLGATGLLGTTQAGAAIFGAAKAGARVGGTVMAYDQMRRQQTGSNYRQIIQRLESEGIPADVRAVTQISKLTGAVTAGIGTLADEVLLGMFAGTPKLQKSFFNVVSSQKFADQMVNIVMNKVKKFGHTMGQEVLLEMAEEVVEYVATEAYVDSAGSETAFDMSREEFLELAWGLTRDTVVNTMVYGGAFGAVGAAADIAVNRRNAKIVQPSITFLSPEQKTELSALPTYQEGDIQIGPNDTLSFNVPDEQVDLEGETIHQALVTDPAIADHISPAQKAIVQRYIDRNPSAVKLTEALAFLTGKTDTELRGLSEFNYQKASVDEHSLARFAHRVTEANPEVLLDGTDMYASLETEGDAVVNLAFDGDTRLKLDINVVETGATSTISLDITKTGALSIASSSGDMDGADIQAVMQQILPSKYMFDGNVEVDPAYRQSVANIAKIIEADPETLTLADLDKLDQESERITKAVADKRIVGETKVISKEVPELYKETETYFEDQEVIEDIVEEPAEPVQEELPATTSEKYKGILDNAEAFIAQQELDNASRIEEGKTPKDLARWYESIERMKEAYSSLTEAEKVGTPDVVTRRAEGKRLAGILDNVNEVYEAHKNERIHEDQGEYNRKVLIVRDYAYQLTPEASRYFTKSNGFYVDVDSFVGLLDNLEEIASRNLDAELGLETTADALPAHDRASGMVDASDIRALTGDTVQKTEQDTAVAKEGKVIGQETKTRRVRKTKTTQKTRMADKKFEIKENDSGYSTTKVLEQAIDEAAALSGELRDKIEQMISLTRDMARNIQSPEYRNKIRDLANQYNFSLYTDEEIAVASAQSNEGIGTQEFDRNLEAGKGRLKDLPLRDLQAVYNQTLAAARTDFKLTGYKIGEIEIGYKDVMRSILAEVSRDGAIKGSHKQRGRIFRSMKALYDHLINYDLLVEKIHGKKTMIYKLLYGNIKEGSMKQRRFMHEFTKEYSNRFVNLPGIKNASQFYDEVMLDFGEFKLTKELLLTLKQHLRAGDGYNWRMLKESGFSYYGRFQSRQLSVLEQEQVFQFVETYVTNSADNVVLDTFQSGMDRLYVDANTRNIDLFGTELDKSEFYIRMRPDPSFVLDRSPFDSSMKDEVNFAFAPANVKERMGTGKPILLTGMGTEFMETADSISEFYYVYKDFAVAQNIVNNSAFKQALTRNFHDDYHGFLVDGLQRWAGQREPTTRFDDILDWSRKQFASGVLTINPEVAIKQTLSFPFFGVYVDMPHLINGAFEAILHPDRVHQRLTLWSTNYATRQEDAGSWDMKDTMAQKKGKNLLAGSKALDKVKWYLIRKADINTVRAGMNGAFTQVLSEIERGYFSEQVMDALDVDSSLIQDLSIEGKNQLAAKFADYTLERTQPMQNPEHASTFQRKTALGRSFSAFGSYTNQINNLMHRTNQARKRGDANAGKAFYTTLFMSMLAVPALTGSFDAAKGLLWQGVRGKEEWEKKTFWQLFGSAYYNSVTGYWFVVRDAAKMAQQLVTRGASADSGTELVMFEQSKYAMLAAGQLFNAMWPANTDEVREEAWKNGLMNSAKAISYIGGLPYYPMKYGSALIERSKD